MSVLIKGMEMPKNCYDCPFAMQDYTTLFGNNFKQTKNSYACVLTHKTITSTKRNRFCPLVPVPSHGRLKDVDALNDMINRSYPMTDRIDVHNGYAICQEMIKQLPTIEERKRGRWVLDNNPHDGDCRCSVCGIAIDQMHEKHHGLLNALTGGKWWTFYKFCPNCGADMRGEANDSSLYNEVL